MRTSLFGDSFSSVPYGALSTARTASEGERLAAHHLRSTGWTLLGRNVMFGKDEVDIVALDTASNVLHLIEVRTSKKAISPRLTISKRKKTALFRVKRLVEERAGQVVTCSVIGVNLTSTGSCVKLHAVK